MSLATYGEFGAKLGVYFVRVEQFDLATLDVVDAAAELPTPSSIDFGLLLIDGVVHLEAKDAAMKHLGAVVAIQGEQRLLHLCGGHGHGADCTPAL